MRELLETSRGYTIFVEDNPVGGRTYWSDSVGGGVIVWDTSLVSTEELLLAITEEIKALNNDGERDSKTMGHTQEKPL